MTGLKLVATGYSISGITALLSAEFPDPAWMTPMLQYGALGILGFTTFGLFYVIVILVKGYKTLSDSADKRETQHHEDSVKLNETLSVLREHCAANTATDIANAARDIHDFKPKTMAGD